MRKTIGIFGCGNIGSRYLQSFNLSEFELDLKLYDKSNKSLKKSLDIFKNNVVGENHKISDYIYNKNIELPETFDLVIISTSSFERLEVIKNIYTRSNINHLILEKILFPRLEDYDTAKKILSNNKVHVNCANRAMESYRALKDFIDLSKPIKFIVSGSNWGLACNSIHYLDFFKWISNSNKLKLVSNKLKKTLYPSKRDNYNEFYGEFSAIDELNNQIWISCNKSFNEHNQKRNYKIINGETSIFIDPDRNICKIMKNKRHFHSYEFIEEKVSDYFSIISNKIFNNIEIDLPTYTESSETHIFFIKMLQEHLKSFMPNKKWNEVPIT